MGAVDGPAGQGRGGRTGAGTTVEAAVITYLGGADGEKEEESPQI